MAAGINDKFIAAVSSYPECEGKLIIYVEIRVKI